MTFDEFRVLSECVGRHTHPIFKKALDNIAPDSHKDTVTVAFSGTAQGNEAFLRLAAKSWRALSSVANFDEQSIAQAFRMIDVDNDGYLTPVEIRRAIKEVAPSITEVDITLMLATADRDSDGFITFPEFCQMMLYRKDDDTAYWEKYGARDMHSGTADRSGQLKRR